MYSLAVLGTTSSNQGGERAGLSLQEVGGPALPPLAPGSPGLMATDPQTPPPSGRPDFFFLPLSDLQPILHPG